MNKKLEKVSKNVSSCHQIIAENGVPMFVTSVEIENNMLNCIVKHII